MVNGQSISSQNNFITLKNNFWRQEIINNNCRLSKKLKFSSLKKSYTENPVELKFAGTTDDLYFISSVERLHFKKKISFQS